MENGEISLNKEKLSFGEVLKKARVEKNLTIDDIVTETRISKLVLEQIESNEPDDLPEPVFLRGFLKSYAEQVDLDPVHIVEMYKTAFGIEDKPPVDVAETVGQSVYIKNDSSKRPFAIVVFILCLIALITFSVMRKKEDLKDDMALKQGVEAGQADASDTQAKAIVKDFILEVVCVEDTTLKISSDGEKVTEYKMKPEDTLELKAKKEFNILIDNTCGVTLFLNNNPVDIAGKCGQTVNVQLP